MTLHPLSNLESKAWSHYGTNYLEVLDLVPEFFDDLLLSLGGLEQHLLLGDDQIAVGLH